MREYFSIAVDGPAGAGKSTIAKLVAKKLGFIYIDTGAMYRAMGLYFIRKGVSSDDERTICEKCDEIDIRIEYDNGSQLVFLNGENVSVQIREEEIGRMASAVSVYGAVRTKLVELQRGLAARENVIMDGRDIASCVLPDAQLKIYLTASVEVRARRRFEELKGKGQECDFEQIKEDIRQRDYRDMNRDISPLVKVDDAVEVDTSDMSIEEVADKIIEMFKEVSDDCQSC